MLLLGLLALASCDTSHLVAGIDGSGARIYANGPIQAFGSVVLNGIHYDIAGAEIRVNGELATEDDLAIGQVVTVQAVGDAKGGAVAESVDFESDLRGPITALDAVNARLTVLGQDIRVGPETVLDLGAGADLSTLQAGDRVEISGFRGAGSVISASYVKRASAADGLRILGPVRNLDVGAHTFTIGALTVDYTSAGLIEGFPVGEPRNGDRVLAEGPSLNGSGALVAVGLRYFEPEAADREGQEAEVEGLITRFVSATDFDIAGKPATTTPQTIYEGGSAADLALDAKIQIEGRFDTNGTIVARKIEVKDNGGFDD